MKPRLFHSKGDPDIRIVLRSTTSTRPITKAIRASMNRFEIGPLREEQITGKHQQDLGGHGDVGDEETRARWFARGAS